MNAFKLENAHAHLIAIDRIRRIEQPFIHLLARLLGLQASK